jgi:VanZ family protein
MAAATPAPAGGTLRPLRHPRLWLGLWLAGLLATLLAGVLPLRFDSGLAHGDKLGHLLVHAALAAAAALLFASRRALAAAGAGLLLFGAAIELLQALLPWRSAEVADLLANGLGTALGLALAATPLAGGLGWLERRWRRR